MRWQMATDILFYYKSSASEKRMGEKRACTNFHPSILTEGAPVHEQKELR